MRKLESGLKKSFKHSTRNQSQALYVPLLRFPGFVYLFGSQSVAQVHRAVLNTGEEVAVKVQRPDIVMHAESDIVAYKLFMKLYGL